MGENTRECAETEREGLLTTGDMARLSASTLRTVRFYEEAGLLEPECRSAGGHRLFEKRQLTKLQLALDLREGGLSVQDIKALFYLKSECQTPEEASKTMSGVLQEKIDCMQSKIDKLRNLRQELTSMIQSISDCNSCESPSFPLGCGDCDSIDKPDVTRALQVLWQDDKTVEATDPTDS